MGEAARPPAQLRGVLVSMVLRWARKTYGDAPVDEAIQQLSAADRALFSRLVMSVGWYPFPAWERFVEKMRERLAARGHPVDLFHASASRDVSEGLMSALFRSILARINPVLWVDRIPMIYQRLYDQGIVTIEENEPGRAVVSLRVPPEMEAYARRSIVPGCESILRLSGVRELHTEHEEAPGFFRVRLRYLT